MDRRGFLGLSSLGFASMALPQLARGEGSRSPFSQADKPLQTIGFGSCSKLERSQLHWDFIGRDAPDLWIWLGDIIYADNVSPAERRAEFQRLKFHPLYERFRRETPVIGTWDDHDYGDDNADMRYPYKEDSKEILLKFLDVPCDAPVWGHEGVYQSYVMGHKGRQTHVILLDLRYSMDKKRSQRQLLGETQWRWFENEIRTSRADLIVIGSSLAVTSPVVALSLEGWRNFREEQQRLYTLLEESDKPTLILSGDRHFAETYSHTLASGKVIYEFMSSGMTHAIGVKLPHPGRLTEMVGQKNYGLLQIDWSGPAPLVRMQVRGAEINQSLQESIARFF